MKKSHTHTLQHSQPESSGQNLDSTGLQWSLVENETWSLSRDWHAKLTWQAYCTCHKRCEKVWKSDGDITNPPNRSLLQELPNAKFSSPSPPKPRFTGKLNRKITRTLQKHAQEGILIGKGKCEANVNFLFSPLKPTQYLLFISLKIYFYFVSTSSYPSWILHLSIRPSGISGYLVSIPLAAGATNSISFGLRVLIAEGNFKCLGRGIA